METPTNEPVPTTQTPIVERQDYFEAAQKLRHMLMNVAIGEYAGSVRQVVELLDRTALIADVLNNAAQLRLDLDQANIQNQLLQQMLGAGSGESLGDETCLFIGPDDVQCALPATQLLIDPSGQRCPVCDEHAKTAPPGLKLVAAS